jgi:hypothetical protein
MPARSITPMTAASSVSTSTHPQPSAIGPPRPTIRNAIAPPRWTSTSPSFTCTTSIVLAHGHRGMAGAAKWYSTNATGMPSANALTNRR